MACPAGVMPKGPAMVGKGAPLSWDSGTQSRVPNHEGISAFFVILHESLGLSP